MPLFSVIIPIYKVELYLSECIESILSQTYTDFELILVDDGSPDNCGKICDEYAAKDARVRVIHKKNGGVTSARLAGVEAAVGTYIACVDGDDWVSSEYLLNFANCTKDCVPDIVCCGFVEANADKLIEQPCFLSAGYYDKEQIKNEVFPVLIKREDGIQFPNTLCSKVIRRELFLSQQMKVDKKIKVGEDMAVIKSCLYYADHIYIIKECLYYYRQHSTSVMKSRKAFNMNDPMRIGKHFESQINIMEADFQSQVFRIVVQTLFDATMSQFYRKEKYRVIVKDIQHYIQDPYYQNAIKRCRFRGNWKWKLANMALKYRLYRLMWLYSHIKNKDTV